MNQYISWTDEKPLSRQDYVMIGAFFVFASALLLAAGIGYAGQKGVAYGVMFISIVSLLVWGFLYFRNSPITRLCFMGIIMIFVAATGLFARTANPSLEQVLFYYGVLFATGCFMTISGVWVLVHLRKSNANQ